MRSFIKKLASTMALTMVVTSAAPAGFVFADNVADVDAIALQDSDTIVQEITLRAGKTVDFRFLGAPANWKELKWGWYSTNPNVATVNNNGEVTAVAEGRTTIGIYVGNWEATAVVYVKEKAYEGGVYLAYQNTVDVATESHIAIDDVLDFCFWNAPADYNKNGNTFAWVSSDDAVATVAQDGKVTGVADGKVTISLLLNDVVAASTDVVVGNYVAPEVDEPVVDEPVVEDPVVEDTFVVDYENSGICYLDEKYYEEAVTVGDAVELAVYYVAKMVNGETLVEDYTDIYVEEFEWVSSDDTIATVENGVLTAVAAGEVTLTATGVVVDGYAEEFKATITIAEAEVDNSYEATQTTDKKILLTFADATIAEATKKAFDEAKSADKVNFVKLEKTGKANRNIQIKALELNEDDKTQLTIVTYSAFGDGDTYQITVNQGEPTAITTTLGEVDALEITYKSYENDAEMKDSAGIAYANDEDEDTVTVKLSAKLFSNGVNVTDANGYDVKNVTYAFPEDAEYDDDDVELDEDEGILTFYKPGVVVEVIATYTYEDAEGEDVEVPETVEIVSESMPAYEIIGVKDWAFAYSKDKMKDGKVDWSVKSIPADEEDVYIVALIEDSYGNVYITKDYAGDYKTVEDGKLGDEGYSISFVSTDVTKAIVDGDEVSAWDKTNASIIFKWENSNTETSEEFYAVDFAVKEARKLNKVVVTTEDFEILSATEDADCAKKDITIKLYDQYDKLWAEDEDIEIKAKARINKEDKEYTVSSTDIVDNEDGTYTFKFDSTVAADKIGKDAKKDVDIKYTVTVGKKSDTIKVELVTPEEDVAKLDLGLEAGDVSQTLDRGKEGLTSTVTNNISFYKYSDDLKYGKVETNGIQVLASQSALDNMKKINKDSGVEIGTKYFTILGADGKVYENKDGLFTFQEKENGIYSFVVAKAIDSKIASNDALAMAYAPTGKYTAVIYELEKFKTDGSASFEDYTAKFEVTNTNPVVTVDKQVKLTSTENAVEDMIIDAISFKLGNDEFKAGNDWNQISADDIFYNEKDVIDTGNYVVVKKITVRVRVNKNIEDVYYEVPVEVNKTIQRVND